MFEEAKPWNEPCTTMWPLSLLKHCISHNVPTKYFSIAKMQPSLSQVICYCSSTGTCFQCPLLDLHQGGGGGENAKSTFSLAVSSRCLWQVFLNMFAILLWAVETSSQKVKRIGWHCYPTSFTPLLFTLLFINVFSDSKTTDLLSHVCLLVCLSEG